MNVEVLGTDEFQAWFLDLSVEEQAAVVNVVRKLEIAGVALGRRTRATWRAPRNRFVSSGGSRAGARSGSFTPSTPGAAPSS
jgi:hypothetical protein